MPTPFNPLYHPYMAPHLVARIMAYWKRYRYGARLLVRKQARIAVLRQLRRRQMRAPHYIQPQMVTRGFNIGA